MILIGSAAISSYFRDYKEPLDYDIITNLPELREWYNTNLSQINSFHRDTIYKQYVYCTMKNGIKIDFELADYRDNLSANLIKAHSFINIPFFNNIGLPDKSWLASIYCATLIYPFVKWHDYISNFHFLRRTIPCLHSQSEQFVDLRRTDMSKHFPDHNKHNRRGRSYTHINKATFRNAVSNDPIYDSVGNHHILSDNFYERQYTTDGLTPDEILEYINEEILCISLELATFYVLNNKEYTPDALNKLSMMIICTNDSDEILKELLIYHYPKVISNLDGLNNKLIDLIKFALPTLMNSR